MRSPVARGVGAPDALAYALAARCGKISCARRSGPRRPCAWFVGADPARSDSGVAWGACTGGSERLDHWVIRGVHGGGEQGLRGGRGVAQERRGWATSRDVTVRPGTNVRALGPRLAFPCKKADSTRLKQTFRSVAEPNEEQHVSVTFSCILQLL